MIPLSIAIGTDGVAESEFATAIETAVDSLAHEALAPSTMGFTAAHAIILNALPESAAEMGPAATAGVHRAGEHVWIITSRDAVNALSLMGAHVALSGRDDVMCDIIDGAERMVAAQAERPSHAGGARDEDHDAHQLRDVVDARALADLPPALAVLTAGPELTLSPNDVTDSVIHATTPAKIAENFLIAFARDFATGNEDTP